MAYRIMPIYNIDRTVGEGEANLPHDVKLVQSLIAGLAALGPTPEAPARPPFPDGRFSAELKQWIMAIQKFVASKNGGLRPDGKVHPIPLARNPGDWQSKYSSGYSSTLYALNVFLRDSHRDAHERIGRELYLKEMPLFPKEG
ncbi:MAG: hypothetical protein JNL62_20160 [Bryobacterales bacterium]|nr:hypothetical protein [Bryobacterales bacterium]